MIWANRGKHTSYGSVSVTTQDDDGGQVNGGT